MNFNSVSETLASSTQGSVVGNNTIMGVKIDHLVKILIPEEPPMRTKLAVILENETLEYSTRNLIRLGKINEVARATIRFKSKNKSLCITRLTPPTQYELSELIAFIEFEEFRAVMPKNKLLDNYCYSAISLPTFSMKDAWIYD